MGHTQDYLEDRLRRTEQSVGRFCSKLESYASLSIGEDIDQETLRKGVYELIKEAVDRGKRVRPLLVHLSHDIVGGSFGQIDDLALLPELASKGTIIIDDIQDSAQTRDQKLPLYKSRGVALAINAGNFLYFIPGLMLAQMKMDEHAKYGILKSYMEIGVAGHIGQGADLYWGETGLRFTESGYLQMNALKASAFWFAADVGAIAGGANETQRRKLREVVQVMGIAYQLRDDLLSLDPTAHDYGDDISEGKRSLMVLKTLEIGGTPSQRLQGILSLKTREPALIEEAVQIMRESGSVGYVEQKARNFVERASNILVQSFPDSEYRGVFLEVIHQSVSRNK